MIKMHVAAEARALRLDQELASTQTAAAAEATQMAAAAAAAAIAARRSSGSMSMSTSDSTAQQHMAVTVQRLGTELAKVGCCKLKPMFESARFQRLKLKYDKRLSNFNFN